VRELIQESLPKRVSLGILSAAINDIMPRKGCKGSKGGKGGKK
jgi:hypothetical protein